MWGTTKKKKKKQAQMKRWQEKETEDFVLREIEKEGSNQTCRLWFLRSQSRSLFPTANHAAVCALTKSLHILAISPLKGVLWLSDFELQWFKV